MCPWKIFRQRPLARSHLLHAQHALTVPVPLALAGGWRRSSGAPRGGVVAAGEQEAQVVAQQQRVDGADVRVEHWPEALAVLYFRQHHLMLRDHLRALYRTTRASRLLLYAHPHRMSAQRSGGLETQAESTHVRQQKARRRVRLSHRIGSAQEHCSDRYV